MNASAPPGRPELALWALDRRVLVNAAMLGTATVLIKLVALGKDWMVAQRLGAGDALDAYLIALMIPSYAVAVLGHSFASAFVPGYVRLLTQESLAAANRMTAAALAAAVVMLALVCAALAALAPVVLPLVGSGFDADKLALARSLLYVMVGVLFASGVSSVIAAVLNAHERFVATSIAPVFVPIAMVVAFGLFYQPYGVYALAAGTLVGFALETVWLAVAAARIGLLPWPRFGRFDGALGAMASRYWPLVVGSALMSSSAVVDQSMAASLSGGDVSVLSFGNKLPALVLSVVAVSLSTVLLPRFSHMISSGQWGALRRTINGYAALIVAGSIPVMVLLTVLAEPMIRLLFERGAFTPEMTAAVARVQMYLALQIPFYVFAMLGARLLSALDGNQIVLRIGALNLIVNVAGNYFLMRRFGVDGIAMATSLMYVVATVATVVAVWFKMADARDGNRQL